MGDFLCAGSSIDTDFSICLTHSDFFYCLTGPLFTLLIVWK